MEVLPSPVILWNCPSKKEHERERESARERNCIRVLFLCKVWPQEALNQSGDRAGYEKLSQFGPKYAGGLCCRNQKQETNKQNKQMFPLHYVHWLFCDSHIIHHRKSLSAINISHSLVAAMIKNKAININADKYKANNDIPNCFCVNQLSASILPDWVGRNWENLSREKISF